MGVSVGERPLWPRAVDNGQDRHAGHSGAAVGLGHFISLFLFVAKLKSFFYGFCLQLSLSIFYSTLFNQAYTILPIHRNVASDFSCC